MIDSACGSSPVGAAVSAHISAIGPGQRSAQFRKRRTLHYSRNRQRTGGRCAAEIVNLNVHSKLSPLQLPERRGLQRCNTSAHQYQRSVQCTCDVRHKTGSSNRIAQSCGNAMRYDAQDALNTDSAEFACGRCRPVAMARRYARAREGTRGRGCSRAATRASSDDLMLRD